MADIKDTLEAFATSKGWQFEYARKDYSNLHEAIAFIADTLEGYDINETVLFLDPIVTSGAKRELNQQGNFMILTRSDFDMLYEERYTKFIKPVKDIVHDELEGALRCLYDFNQPLRSIEVINEKDLNGDGVSVSYNLKSY